MDVVKRSEAGMIDEPITISPNSTIGEADAMCARHISGARCQDRELRLLGLITNRDMRFETDLAAGSRSDDSNAADHLAQLELAATMPRGCWRRTRSRSCRWSMIKVDLGT